MADDRRLKQGGGIVGMMMPLLSVADDIVLIAQDHASAQKLLDRLA